MLYVDFLNIFLEDLVGSIGYNEIRCGFAFIDTGLFESAEMARTCGSAACVKLLPDIEGVNQFNFRTDNRRQGSSWSAGLFRCAAKVSTDDIDPRSKKFRVCRIAVCVIKVTICVAEVTDRKIFDFGVNWL
jgi:hypothetical protein